MKTQKLSATVILVFFFLSLSQQTLAASSPKSKIGCVPVPCTGPIVDCTQIDCKSIAGLPDVIGRIIGFILSCIAMPIGILILIIGGFYFLFAGENPENVEKGKKTITAAIIALLIIFLAKGVLNAFLQALNRPPVC